MSRPLISIIIATYNSGKLLPTVFKALNRQTIGRAKLEIILVDGGSTDDTLKIGKANGARIIKNILKEPVTGKFLAYTKTKGKYVMYLDHDEVIVKRDSIEVKVKSLVENPNVKAVAGGNYVNPKGYGFINNYLNDFGDPFTFFMYRISKRNRFFYETMKERYPFILNKSKYSVFNLFEKRLPILELAAGASVFDADTLKKEFPETLKNKWLLPHYYYLLHSKYPEIVVMKDDPIMHYSVESLQKILKKISWRIKNNIYFQTTMGSAGFSGREKFGNSVNSYKKYFFLVYSFLIIPSLYHAIGLSISRRDIRYLIHTPLCFYTASSIVYNYTLKLSGIKPKLKEYGS